LLVWETGKKEGVKPRRCPLKRKRAMGGRTETWDVDGIFKGWVSRGRKTKKGKPQKRPTF